MQDIGAKARDLGSEAIDTLAEVMRDADSRPADKRAAAEALLDRGYGKPVAAIISVPANSEGVRRLAAFSDAALLAAVAAGRVLEGEATPVHPESPVPTPVAVRDSLTTIERGGTPPNANSDNQTYLPRENIKNNSQVPNGIRGLLPTNPRPVGSLLAAVGAPAADAQMETIDPLAL